MREADLERGAKPAVFDVVAGVAAVFVTQETDNLEARLDFI